MLSYARVCIAACNASNTCLKIAQLLLVKDGSMRQFLHYLHLKYPLSTFKICCKVYLTLTEYRTSSLLDESMVQGRGLLLGTTSKLMMAAKRAHATFLLRREVSAKWQASPGNMSGLLLLACTSVRDWHYMVNI